MRQLTIVAVFVAALASPALAAPQDVANKLSGEIMSPFCPGVTLHDCSSREADELREQIRAWAAAGWSEDRIMRELVGEYGPGVRARPPASGSGLPAWALPIAALLLAVAGAATAAIRWTRGRGRADAPEGEGGPEPTPEQRRRLETELAAHEATSTGIVRPRGA